LIYCPKCDRVIIAQIISGGGENVSHVAPVVLGSITDHRHDGWTDWALYGLRFAVPGDYRIEKQTLMSGYLSLSFRNGAKRLVVERWGLAGTLLAKDDLETWYRKDVAPDIKGYRFQIERIDLSGHPGLRMHGRRAGIRQFLRAALSSLTLHPYPGFVTGYAWHCVETNRLLGVRATCAEDDDIAERVRDTIECH
jgi:hypothetical protein